MIVVMNRLTAPSAFRERLEQGFAHSTSHMSAVAGFVNFRLLRVDPQPEGQAVYVVETTWQDEESYENWTHSDAFAHAHGGGRASGPLQTTLERFTVVGD